MNQAIINSYVRSIKRGTRTLESVPASVREAVRAALEGEES